MQPIKLATLAIACVALTLPLGPAASQVATPADSQPQSTTPLTAEELESYVLGNTYFLAYHEFGHAIISEFNIPVLGREEDAVDRLATWMMTPDNGEEDPEYRIGPLAARFTAASKKLPGPIAWWGKHGTYAQRAYQVACLLYGYDPPRYKEIANAAEIPAERRPGCQTEAKQNEKSVTQLLTPHYRSGKPEDAAPKDSVTLIYAPTRNFRAEREMMIKDGVLEELRRLITKEYKFRSGIILSAEDCGEPNAFWKKEERKLLICYDLVREFRKTAETPIQITPAQAQN